MSEENQLQNQETETQISTDVVTDNGTAPQAAPADETPAVEQPAAEASAAENPSEEQPSASSVTQPQVIIQKERGFSHYVGFSLLCVLCVCFFFLPGIFITFGVSRVVSLNGAAAWIFSAILSIIAWLIFKLKIKGFKKSFLFYIALCILILIVLIAIQVGLDYNIFSEILALLTGANA